MSVTLRNGIYYAQQSIPPELRELFGKSNFRRSTGCRDKKHALAEAAPWIKEWQRQIDLARERPDAVLDEIAVLKARAAIERESKAATNPAGFTDAEEALTWYGDSDWLGSLPPSQAAKYADVMFGDGVPLPHFMERFRTDHYAKPKARSEAKRYILEATLFVPTLEKINTENAKAWIRAEASKPASERRAKKTMQKAAGYLSEYVLWLQDQRLLSDAVANPFHKMRYPKALTEPERYEPLSFDEILTLRSAALEAHDSELVAFIDIARYTGMRLAEVGALSADSVEDVDGIWCFRVKLDAKTKKSAGRLVPIAPALTGLLERHGYSLDSFDLARRENAVGKRFGRLKKQILPDGHRRAKCFHSIRKFVATVLERAEIPEGVTADLLGHEKPTMTYGVYSGGSALRQLAGAVETLSAAQPLPNVSNVIQLQTRRTV